MRSVTVHVPATTANLGPGYDCLGLALGLHNEVTLALADEPGVAIDGEGADALPRDRTHLVLGAAQAAADAAGERLPVLDLRQLNRIPLARGMGSSSAAIVGGIVAANRLLDLGLSPRQMLDVATCVEGHPDNVAPALLGGLVIAVQDEQGLIYERLDVPPDLTAALFVPDFPMPTAEARRVLPAQVPRADAVFNMGRVALLVAAMVRRRYDVLDVATRDRLHQPYREAIFPAMPALFDAAREAGALGVFLSGAGSTVIALCAGNAPAVAEGMTRAAQGLGLAGKALVAPLADEGAQAEVVQPPRRRARPAASDHW